MARGAPHRRALTLIVRAPVASSQTTACRLRGIPRTRATIHADTLLCMNPESARHGAAYWLAIALLVLWNAGLLLLAIISRHSYTSCMAGDGYMCLDFSRPILAVLFAVDGIVALVAAFVHWVRVRRS